MNDRQAIKSYIMKFMASLSDLIMRFLKFDQIPERIKIKEHLNVIGAWLALTLIGVSAPTMFVFALINRPLKNSRVALDLA